MKKILKENWLILIVLAILVGVILNFQKSYEEYHIREEFTNQFCHFVVENSDTQSVSSFCDTLLTEPRYKNNLYSNVLCRQYVQNGITNELKEQCSNVIAQENEPKEDFYLMLANMIFDIGPLLNGLSFLFIAIPTLVGICKLLKRKLIINTVTRESYQSFLTRFFKKAYRYVWVLPLIALFMIMICICSTTFDHTYSLTHPSNTLWQPSTIQNRYLFILGYVGNILIYSCFFINLCLITARKYHNTFAAIIVSFLTYTGIELFFEVVIKVFISLTFHNDIGNVLNIMNMWTYSDGWGLFPLLAFSVIMCLLSFLGVYLSYRNKERLAIDCEKNN